MTLEPVRFAAQVRQAPSTAPAPVGEVAFRVDGRQVSVATVGSDGMALSDPLPLSGGDHPVEAIFYPNRQFHGSRAALTQRVARAGTAVEIVASANPSVAGAEVTFDAAVTAVAPGAGTPTGSVTFAVDGRALGEPVPLAGGAARSAAIRLPAGTHGVTASYEGDDAYEPSDGSFVQSVGATATATVLSASPRNPVVGEATEITATVLPPAGSGGVPPTGGVDVLVDGIVVCDAVTLVDGRATCAVRGAGAARAAPDHRRLRPRRPRLRRLQRRALAARLAGAHAAVAGGLARSLGLRRGGPPARAGRARRRRLRAAERHRRSPSTAPASAIRCCCATAAPTPSRSRVSTPGARAARRLQRRRELRRQRRRRDAGGRSRADARHPRQLGAARAGSGAAPTFTLKRARSHRRRPACLAAPCSSPSTGGRGAAGRRARRRRRLAPVGGLRAGAHLVGAAYLGAAGYARVEAQLTQWIAPTPAPLVPGDAGRPAAETALPPLVPAHARSPLLCTRELAIAAIGLHGERVRLRGVADVDLVGQRVAIVSGGKVLARPRVARGGGFTATVPRPRREHEADAVYLATAGSARSQPVALAQPLRIVSVRAAGPRRVRIEAVLDGGGARPLRARVERRVACGRVRTIARRPSGPPSERTAGPADRRHRRAAAQRSGNSGAAPARRPARSRRCRVLVTP